MWLTSVGFDKRRYDGGMKLRWIALFAAGMMFGCGDASTTTASVNARPTEPTPVESAPNVPDAQTQKLIAERDFEAQQLKFHETMLTSSSFSERTDLFCRDVADAALANQSPSFSIEPYDPSPPIDVGAELRRQMTDGQNYQTRVNLLNSIQHGPYGLTIDDLRMAYAQLTRERPSTREAEMLREQKLSAISEAIADHAKEFSACRTAVIYGNPRPFPLPTDEALRVDISKGQQRIAQIDRELLLRKSQK